MQGTFISGGVKTRIMFGGDAEWSAMDEIVSISKYCGDKARLEFHVSR